MRRLLGTTIELDDGTEVTITAVGDYDPPDDIHGSGAVLVECDDGKAYLIWDDGRVYDEDGNKRLGYAAELFDDDPDY